MRTVSRGGAPRGAGRPDRGARDHRRGRRGRVVGRTARPASDRPARPSSSSPAATRDTWPVISDEPAAASSSDVTDHRLTRPDGRVVAWSESGVRWRPADPARARYARLAAVVAGGSDALDRARAARHHDRAPRLRRLDAAGGSRLRRARRRHDRDPRRARHRAAAGLRVERGEPAHPGHRGQASRSGRGA